MRTTPSWQVLKGKLLQLEQRPMPPEAQADPTLPTTEEIRALLAQHQNGITPCRKATFEYSARQNPAFVASLAHAYALQDDTYLQLVKREISWGNYARLLAKWQIETEQKLGVVHADIRRNQANAAAYDMQQRQEANDGLQRWVESQQQINGQQTMIDPSSRPRTTRCQYVGTLLSCTTSQG